MVSVEEIRSGDYFITISYTYDELTLPQYMAIGFFFAFLFYSTSVFFVRGKRKLWLLKIGAFPFLAISGIIILFLGSTVFDIFSIMDNAPFG